MGSVVNQDMDGIGDGHPLRVLFAEAIGEHLARHVSSLGLESEGEYLVGLLLDFMRTDRLYSVRDIDGRPVTSVIEMLAEGDVMLRADSFEREREVHRHIGDYILFWSGVHPAFLRQIKIREPLDLVCDYSSQGKRSYRLVSLFDHGEYAAEAATFRTLSEGFDDFSFVLGQVAKQVRIYGDCA